MKIPDKNGYNAYPRPLIILTPTKEIASADTLVGVVCSSTAPKTDALLEKPPKEHVPLPYQADGYVRTKLKKETVALCEWIASFRKDDIESVGGRVHAELLEKIVALVRSVHTKNDPPSETD